MAEYPQLVAPEEILSTEEEAAEVAAEQQPVVLAEQVHLEETVAPVDSTRMQLLQDPSLAVAEEVPKLAILAQAVTER